MKEMKAIERNVGARLTLNRVGWSVMAYLFADETALLAQCKGTSESSG